MLASIRHILRHDFANIVAFIMQSASTATLEMIIAEFPQRMIAFLRNKGPNRVS